MHLTWTDVEELRAAAHYCRTTSHEIYLEDLATSIEERMKRRAFVVGLGTALGIGAAGAEIEAAAVERAIADAEPGTVLELRPGDVVVLRLPEGVDLSGAEMEALGRRAGDAFGVDAVIVPHGMELSAVRPPNAS